MGIFDFFKKKNKGIDDVKFQDRNFQNSVCALALYKLQENNFNTEPAIYELKNLGLNDKQIEYVLAKCKSVEANTTKKLSFEGIEEQKFKSNLYQISILEKAQKLYFMNNQSYDVVLNELLKEGLNKTQAEEIIVKLKTANSKSEDAFEDELESDDFEILNVVPNEEHTKENTTQDQVDMYIGFGAYQLESGNLDNALALLDKAIELDDTATLAYANKGKLYALKEDYMQALYFTNKALEFEPTHEQILDNKLDILYEILEEEKMDEHEFIANVNDVRSKSPENPNALIYCIQYYLKHNLKTDALTAVKQLFKNYFHETLTIQLMIDTMNLFTEEEALIEFKNIEKEVNERAQYQLYYNKGLYLKGIRKYDHAIEVFNQLNQIEPFSWNYYQIAIINNVQGNLEACLENLKLTFDLEPDLKEDAKHYHELQNLADNKLFNEIVYS